MIILECTDTEGGVINLEGPISMELDKAYESPCQQLIITLPLKGAVGEIAEVKLYADGALLFAGLVDKQTEALNGEGAAVTFECRETIPALLLDNEVLPSVYYYITLSDVVKRYAAEFGLKGVKGANPRLTMLTVSKGSSAWQVLEQFCRQSLGYLPRVTPDGYLTTDPPEETRRIPVSNLMENAFNYTEIKREVSRCEVISAVRIFSRSYGYFTLCTNKESGGVVRRRLLSPPSEWSIYPQKSAEQVIKKAMLNKTEVTVTLPDIVRCEVGDVVDIYDKPFDCGGMFVKEVCHMVGDGISTRLTLCDKRYI